METTNNLTESAKFKLILQLSQDQVGALKQNDFSSFQRILTAKGALITTLSDHPSAAAGESPLGAILRQIQDSEKLTEKLLHRRLDSIRNRLGEIQQAKLARRAYRKGEHKLPRFVPTSETPLMFDLRR